VPQTQADLADVSKQIIDPVELGTSLVVPPVQTVAIPSQIKVPITKSLPMTSFINTIVTLGNFLLKIFHWQLQ